MATAEEIGVVVEIDEEGQEPRVVVPGGGILRLNKTGVELANFLRSTSDRELFVYAEPVLIVGLEDDKYIVEIGDWTRILVSPDDNYFL